MTEPDYETEYARQDLEAYRKQLEAKTDHELEQFPIALHRNIYVETNLVYLFP